MPEAPSEPGAEPDQWLVVGLGNPGEEYRHTPHNMGFLLVEMLAGRMGAHLKLRECQAVTGRGEWAGRTVWLAQPQTFMNLSGASVRRLVKKHPQARLLVVYDELDLPWGALRLRERGSAGTHNGMRSVVESVGREFARLKLGIAPPHRVAEAARYVLAPMGTAMRKSAEEFLAAAADAVELLVAEGMAKAMNRTNTRPGPETD